MLGGTDVVRQGFARSFAKPGGSITGLTRDVGIGAEIKRLEFLREAVPGIPRAAVLFDPPYDEEYGTAIRETASALGMKVSLRDITDDSERSFAAVARERVDAVLTLPRCFGPVRGSSTEFSRGQSPPICRSSSRRRSIS
jgi:ABC-type uncharacterized transport system substrate-binding protein